MNIGRKALLIHCRRAPYGTSLAREAIDLALAASAFEQQVSILFSGDGVWQLLADQQPEALATASHARLLQSLPLYDIDRLFVAKRDLEERQLCVTQLVIPATPVDEPTLQALFRDADQVYNF